MKCRSCDDKAVINMRQHRLSLCSAHFNEWFLKHCAGTIKRYGMIKPGDKILIAVSGGKDSLGLWEALTRLGYQAEGVTIHLGIDNGSQYSDRFLELTRKFSSDRELTLHEMEIKQVYGVSVPELFLRSHNDDHQPCSICGLVKRHELNGYALEYGFNVLATGHNLDDEASVLIMNNFTWNSSQLGRQSPVMEEREKFARRIKPFVRFYERETTAFALLNNIDYIEAECPFSKGSPTNHYKTILNSMENEKPGLKYQYYNSFIDKKKSGHLKFSESRVYEEFFCSTCGQPTNAVGLCAFCRLDIV